MTGERTLRDRVETQHKALMEERRRRDHDLQATIARIGRTEPKEKQPAWSR